MLKMTERNAMMLGKIKAGVDEILARHKVPHDSGEYPEGYVPFDVDIKETIDQMNEDADGFSGTKSVAWFFGSQEFTISWLMKQGCIMQFAIKRFVPGLVRATHEQTFLS